MRTFPKALWDCLANIAHTTGVQPCFDGAEMRDVKFSDFADKSPYDVHFGAPVKTAVRDGAANLWNGVLMLWEGLGRPLDGEKS